MEGSCADEMEWKEVVDIPIPTSNSSKLSITRNRFLNRLLRHDASVFNLARLEILSTNRYCPVAWFKPNQTLSKLITHAYLNVTAAFSIVKSKPRIEWLKQLEQTCRCLLGAWGFLSPDSSWKSNSIWIGDTFLCF